MENKRMARNDISKNDVDILKPLDVTEFGSEDDPCFGKLHDLKAEECMDCGDSEFCTIVQSQNLHKERLEIEAKQKFKDVEEIDAELVQKREQAKELILLYKNKGINRIRIVLLVSEKLNISKDIVKQLYNKI